MNNGIYNLNRLLKYNKKVHGITKLYGKFLEFRAIDKKIQFITICYKIIDNHIRRIINIK